MNCLKCGMNISKTREDGVNETDYYECLECNLGFNVLVKKLEE